MIAVAHVAPLLRGFGPTQPTPTIAVVDHADNTGATATIGATLAGSTNVVYVQDFAGELGAGSWQEVGSRTGNGDVLLSLAAGHYFAYVVSSLSGGSAASNVAYFVVTDGVESLHSRCLAAAQARIRSLTLSGLSSERVIVRKLPLDRNLAGSGGVGLPAIVLCPQRTAMPPNLGTTNFDDVHYDVLVAIFDRDNQEPTLQLNLDRHLLWREQISRAFRNQRLGGVPEVIDAQVEPADGALVEAWKNELLASALLVRFISRESRGF